MGLFRRSSQPIVRLDIPITPIPKGRPRFSRRGSRTYTPARTLDYEKALRAEVVKGLSDQADEFPVYPKGVHVRIMVDFIFERPKTKSRKKDPDGLLWRIGREDGDNLEKAVLDALKGVLWHDDNQVVSVTWRKMYAPKRTPCSEHGTLMGEARGPRVCIYTRAVTECPVQRTCSFGALLPFEDYEDE